MLAISGQMLKYGHLPGKRSAPSGLVEFVALVLRDLHALGPGALRTLSSLECDGLPFAQVIEAYALAGGVVKEILHPVAGQNETETLVADNSLNRAVHRCHSAPPTVYPEVCCETRAYP